jgi:hypothetical protein
LEINLKKLQLLIPWELGNHNIQTSKFYIFLGFFIVNFFTPKLLKIRWSSLFWGTFAPHFQIKLRTRGSNLNSIFVIVKIHFVDGGLDSIVDLVKFLEKNKKIHI